MEIDEDEDAGEISDNGEIEDESAIIQSNENSMNGTAQAPPTVKRITCRLCNKRISTKTGLKKHMILEHGMTGNLVGCTLCKAEFANDKGLKVHLFRSHQIRESDYATVLPAHLLDPATQQLRKLQQNREEQKIIEDNENGVNDYECDICHIVCRSKEQLKEHGREVHLMEDNGDSSDEETGAPDLGDEENSMSRANSPTVEELWHQCRYCDRSFNSSKKLTIHMHSHDAVDQTDHSCKDCGIKYASKKSLWVHRHKKHPRIPEPMQCDICKKVFFDRTEHFYHYQTHSNHPLFNENSMPRPPIDIKDDPDVFDPSQLLSFLDASENQDSGPMDDAYKRQQFQRQQQLLQQQQSTTNTGTSGSSSRKRPPPTQNPIVDEDGVTVYACDMCPKKFPVANALQVHRGWHFRSPDGRKVRDPQQMWQPDQVPPSKVRRMANPIPPTRSGTSTPPAQSTPPPPPVCPYCDNKFASHNNLRRHIIEVHKRHESKDADLVSCDRVGECTNCNKTFSTLAEWVDHKISDARNRRMNANYEWKCDVCAKVFTRKERLLQHMLSHLNDREMDADVLKIHNDKLAARGGIESEENTMQSNGKDDERNGDHQEESDNENGMDDDLDQSSAEEGDTEDEETEPVESKRYFCQLCTLDFESSADLRKHVAEHFLNGGIEGPSSNPPNQQTQNPPQDQEEDDTKDSIADEASCDEIEGLEEDYADIEYEDNIIEEQEIPAEQMSEDELGEDTNSSQTSSSMQSNDKLLQNFAAISQDHVCRVCHKTYPDQLTALTCMNSHLNSN